MDWWPWTTKSFSRSHFRNPVNEAIAKELERLALSDAWLVSGCLVQTVWNVQPGRDVDYGINDYDIFYFDPDTSWQAEDAVIRQSQGELARLGVKIEVRNQARVHLWYPEKHGLPYPALHCSTDGIHRFLTTTTQVGIRRTQAGHDVRSSQFRAKFFSRQLRGKDNALEEALAGAHRARRRWCGLSAVVGVTRIATPH